MRFDSPNLRILITGATGFLGRAITRQLLGEGRDVRTTGRRKVPSADVPHYRAADLGDRVTISELLSGVDVVIHAAGLAHQHRATSKNAADFFHINSDGTRCVANAAVSAGCRRMVLVSSVAVYGEGAGPRTESQPCVPRTDYARSKYEAEQRAAEVAASSGLELIILRMATLYGEGDPGNVGRLAKAIEGRRFVWIGNGRNRKSLVHVDDAARACIAAALCPVLPKQRVFNVSAPPCTMEDIVSSLARAMRRRPPTLRLSAPILLSVAKCAGVIPAVGKWSRRAGRLLEKWLSDDVCDGSRFVEAFRWRPLVSLEEGTQQQVRGRIAA